MILFRRCLITISDQFITGRRPFDRVSGAPPPLQPPTYGVAKMSDPAYKVQVVEVESSGTTQWICIGFTQGLIYWGHTQTEQRPHYPTAPSYSRLFPANYAGIGIQLWSYSKRFRMDLIILIWKSILLLIACATSGDRSHLAELQTHP